MNTKFPLKNVFQQHGSRGVNATKSVHLFASQPFESRKSRTTRNIAVFGEGRNDRCWKTEKNTKKKKKKEWKEITVETQRWEKRTGEESSEEKVQCVRQKMAGYLRSYSTLIFSLPIIMVIG